MSERCDHCGKLMEDTDRDAEHATIHVGVCGKDPKLGMFFGDSWYLLCHDCLKEWREKFVEWLEGDTE